MWQSLHQNGGRGDGASSDSYNYSVWNGDKTGGRWSNMTQCFSTVITTKQSEPPDVQEEETEYTIYTV